MASKKKSPRNENSFRGDKIEEKEEHEDLTPSHYTVQSDKTTTRGTVKMSLIDPSEFNLDEAEEPEVVPAGNEVKVRIISVRVGKTKETSKDYFSPTYEIMDNMNAKDFNDYVGIPMRGKMQVKEYKMTAWKMRCMYECFGISTKESSNPQEDWLGLEGWVIVGVRENPGFGQQNYVEEYIRPK